MTSVTSTVLCIYCQPLSIIKACRIEPCLIIVFRVRESRTESSKLRPYANVTEDPKVNSIAYRVTAAIRLKLPKLITLQDYHIFFFKKIVKFFFFKKIVKFFFFKKIIKFFFFKKIVKFFFFFKL